MSGNPRKHRSHSQTRFKQGNSSKQEDKHNENVTNMSKLSIPKDDLLTSLECPICMNTMVPPIYFCEFGHSICNTCCQQLKESICPLCLCKLTKRRNIALESISNMLCTPCPNSGCDFSSLTGEADTLEEHKSICKFRQTCCPIGKILKNCSWTGQLSNVLSHVHDNHKAQRKLPPAGRRVTLDNFQIKRFDEDMQVMNIKDDLFLYHKRIHPANNIACWAIQYVGSEKDAEMWMYKFHIFNSKNANKLITVQDVCTPDHEHISLVFQQGNCVAIPLNVLENFVSEDRKLSFKLYIYKINDNDKQKKGDQDSNKK